MVHIGIAGAGEIGGALAHLLARANVASTVRLIDDSESVAAGKALDIAQAGAVEGFATVVSGTGDWYVASSLDLVVIADRARDGEWAGEEALALLRRLVALRAHPLILCAGVNHRELVERGVRELHIDPRILFGSAPEALAGAVRALVALEADGSPQDVALTVLGVPPAHVVVPWEDATVAGLGVHRVLAEPALRRLAARLPSLWPPGPRALAAAAVKTVAAILSGSRRQVSCFVGPDDSAGARVRASAMPVELGPDGIRRVVVPELSAHDRVTFENARML